MDYLSTERVLSNLVLTLVNINKRNTIVLFVTVTLAVNDATGSLNKKLLLKKDAEYIRHILVIFKLF